MESTNLFYLLSDEVSPDKNLEIKEFFERLKEKNSQRPIYIIQEPLPKSQKYHYVYKEAFIVLSPGHKIIFINMDEKQRNSFNEYVEDFIEDLSAISDKYEYKTIIGRPRNWTDILVTVNFSEIKNIEDFLIPHLISDNKNKTISNLLISLLIGSINDIRRIGSIENSEKDYVLDVIKKKIILFDADQTNFLYKKLNKKKILIQGLSGTGKTELLLHKLKELYISSDDSKIMFTCHNKVLADDLRKRIPVFFNFTRVEQQILWEKRLWCVHAWESRLLVNSGLYRYICDFYEIPFSTFSNSGVGYANNSFEDLCSIAIKEIDTKYPKGLDSDKFAFDYILIDESQDFGEKFFTLCEKVTKEQVFVAGDVFQRIFGTMAEVTTADYLLNRCYRTDPKTLMFAHALSMGLFEKEKLQWLEEKQWTAYGYNVTKDDSDNTIILERELLYRFDDIEQKMPQPCFCINIEGGPQIFAKEAVQKIKLIQRDNPTVTVNDIGIILMETNRTSNTLVASLIRTELEQAEIVWEVNRVFETKEKIENQLFITNYNNVKGLEFPFIICLAFEPLGHNLIKRNALYMAMSRSFLQSYLLMSNVEDNVEKGLKIILDSNYIKTTPITPDNQENIKKLNLLYDSEISRPYKDIIFEEIDKISRDLSLTKKMAVFDMLMISNKEQIHDKKMLSEILGKLIDAVIT